MTIHLPSEYIKEANWDFVREKLFHTGSAICQLYHGENKLNSIKMMMMSTLY